MAPNKNDEKENLKKANREKEALEKKNAQQAAAGSELRQPDAAPEKTDAKSTDESKSNKQENVINNSDIIKESASELSGWAKAMTEMLANMIKLVEELPPTSLAQMKSRINDYSKAAEWLKSKVFGKDKDGPEAEDSQAKQQEPVEQEKTNDDTVTSGQKTNKAPSQVNAVNLKKPNDTESARQKLTSNAEKLSEEKTSSSTEKKQPSPSQENQESPKPN